jgi:hypothetical protein
MSLAATLALSVSLTASTLGTSSTASAQDTAAALTFLGVRAGAPLDGLSAELRGRHGSLRCRPAKSDPTVRECRGTLPDSIAGELAVWVSAMNDTAGVIALSAPVSAAALRAWQSDLSRRYGRVKTTTQGQQRMMQWVRRGRMLRLTWRIVASEITASVSLVDGRVLDGWGRARELGAPASR